MQPYINSLEIKAYELNVDLKEAFRLAGLPDSTFYRVKNGQDMRYKTARKVACALEELYQTPKESIDENTNIS